MSKKTINYLNRDKTISDIGEFGLIDIIKKSFKGNDKNIIADIGDDAFSFKSDREIISITKDMLIEDIHFKKEWISPFELGKKVIETNISDIAAMGKVSSKYIFIGLGIPNDIKISYLKQFIKGIKSSCYTYGAMIKGGDTVKAEKISISVTVIGISTNKVIKRSGAQNGDLIGITNYCGDSGAGLDLLYKTGLNPLNKYQKYLISKHNCPKARVKESAKISKFVNSMTDSSDGLYFSLQLLTKASSKGAEIIIDKIPISKQLQKTIKDKNKQIDYALFGAEDYELVFTVSPDKAKKIKKLLPQVSYIGEIKSTKGMDFIYNGKKFKIKYKGFKHF
jgi:thiamine-monophosphate kinase